MEKRRTESQQSDIQFAAALEMERTLEEIADRLRDLASQIRARREVRVEEPEVHSDVAIPPDDVLERLRTPPA
jgi:hypothetical protein